MRSSAPLRWTRLLGLSPYPAPRLPCQLQRPLHARYGIPSLESPYKSHLPRPKPSQTFLGEDSHLKIRRGKRSATIFSQTHPSPQVRPLPGQDTPPPAEPLEPRAPRRQGGGRAGQTATLQNLIRIPTVGLQFFRAGMVS